MSKLSASNVISISQFKTKSVQAQVSLRKIAEIVDLTFAVRGEMRLLDDDIALASIRDLLDKTNLLKEIQSHGKERKGYR